MQKLKSNMPNMVCVLTVVAVLCGGILAYIYDLTDAPRKAAAENALNAGIEQVMGGKCTVADKKEVKRTVDGKQLTYIIYPTDKGTAVQSTDPNGFGGNLTVLVGFNNAGDILGYTVLENNETPGLYRMIYPYDGKFAYNEAGNWDASAAYNVEVNCEDPEGVYILPQSIGIDWSYGPVAIASSSSRSIMSSRLMTV